MALTNTTLSAACTASALQLSITSTSSGFPAVGVLGSRQVLLVDGEYMLIDQVPVANTCNVLQRGYNGTAAAAHQILSAVSTSATASDFLDIAVGAPDSKPPYVDDVVTIGVDTTFTASGTTPNPASSPVTIPIPLKNTTYLITKATAAAIILVSATAAQVGLKLTFINGIAAANTITYTPGFLGDTTSSDVATSASKVGATITIEVGYTGLWASTNAFGSVSSYTVG